jgi:hypothetical protein
MKSIDAEVLNTGLDMAMAFGEFWLQPIQARLHARYPHLSESELDECNEHCQKAMKFGHTELPQCWRATRSKKDAAFQLFRERVLALYPWVAAANLEHLFSQGCYYAWKDGELS